MIRNELTNDELCDKGDAEEKNIILGLEGSNVYYMLKKNAKFVMYKRREGSRVFDDFKKHVREKFNCEVVDFEDGQIALVKRPDSKISKRQTHLSYF